MSRPRIPLDISNITKLEDSIRYNAIVSNEFYRVLNGSVSFTDNMFVSRVEVTFASSGVDVVVPHTLQVVPTGYIPVKRSAAITIYDGSNSAWTSDYLYLRSDGAGTATILVFA